MALALLLGILSAVGLVIGYVAPRWPYSQRVLAPALQDAFKMNVSIQSFHRFYFPHPGCTAEYVRLERPTKASAQIPLVTVQKMIVTGRYRDLIFRPHHVEEIALDGLYVRIPPRSTLEPSGNWRPSENFGSSSISIGSIRASTAVLEVASENGKAPLKFQIHEARVESVAARQPMTYQVSMSNPEPPGEVQSHGKFGPWQFGQIGAIPLRGEATLKDAKLDKYHGIGGTLESREQFSGTLDHVDVTGEAAAANFQVKSAGHAVRLTSRFRVTVNTLSGEARLSDVIATVGQTTARVHGSIAKNPQEHRRETSLDFVIQHGRAENLLWLFNSASKPAMLGTASCSGHIQVAQFGPGFLQNLTLKGRFEVHESHFQKRTQAKTNELSARAQGKKIKDPSEAPEVAVDTLASDVTIQKAVARFSNLYFQVPAASARMHGTYNFLNDQVDLHGDLQTKAAISQESSGIKSVLLKPFDPIFRKKHAGAQVPVLMNGRMDNPHFGTEIPPK